MSNIEQPQGVTKVLDVSTVPETGFFTNEFIEDDQVVLPNVITITGDAAEVPLVINDGLLRTHTDVMTIHTMPAAEQKLSLIFPKMMFDALATATKAPDTYIAHQHDLTIPAGEKWTIDIRQQDSMYIVTHSVLDDNTGEA